jgi:branched-chain amino acid transport system substrate-binding protein
MRIHRKFRFYRRLTSATEPSGISPRIGSPNQRLIHTVGCIFADKQFKEKTRMQGISKLRTGILLVTVISAALMAVACSSDPTPTPTTVAVAADPTATPTPKNVTVTIGATVPLSGSLSVWGDLVRESLQCGIDHINADGFIPNVTLELKTEDSKGDAAEGLSAMRKLVSVDKVPAVFTIFTNIALAQAPIADDLEVVLWSSGVQHPEFGKMSPWTYRNALSALHTADGTVRYIYDVKGEKDLKWGIIYNSGNDATQIIRDRVKKLVGVLGGEIVAEEAYAAEDRDFRTQLTKLKAAGADVLWLSTVGTETGLMLQQAVEVGFEPKYKVGGIGENGQIIETAGAAADGYLFASPSFDPASSDPRIVRFAECYKAARNVPPDGFAAAFYDGVYTLAEGIKAGGTTATEIHSGLDTLTGINGVGGIYSFNAETGDAWQSLSLRGAVNGAYTTVVPSIDPYLDIE